MGATPLSLTLRAALRQDYVHVLTASSEPRAFQARLRQLWITDAFAGPTCQHSWPRSRSPASCMPGAGPAGFNQQIWRREKYCCSHRQSDTAGPGDPKGALSQAALQNMDPSTFKQPLSITLICRVSKPQLSSEYLSEPEVHIWLCRARPGAS